MNRTRLAAIVGLSFTALLLAACSGKPEEPAAPVTPAAPAEIAPPVAVQEPLAGAPTTAVVLAQAWFWKDANKKSNAGPARLQIWRETAEGWKATRLEDPDSNVFHKSVFVSDGLLTIGGTKAMLKKWKWDGAAWTQDTLWQQSWGGKFDRLRDIEIGDVDGDGKEEYVIATHDHGVIAVFSPDDPTNVIELNSKPDTFVHEVEIGDIDGDGKKEFVCTPSDRNQANVSQNGELALFRWDGTTYQHTAIDTFQGTHAKEVLLYDINQDGKDDILTVLEAEIGPDKSIAKPVEIRWYKPAKDGTFTHETVATIDDRQTRFLTAGDVDGDGLVELVAAAMKSGVWILDQGEDGKWTSTNIDKNSGGFEHASVLKDVNGDGKLELYVAADDQRELKRYVYNPETKSWDTFLIGKLESSTFTWGISAGTL